MGTDREVLQLRGDGRSFSSIAGRLGLKRSKDAYKAFHRALGSCAETERSTIVVAERQRLDLLEARIRDRDASAPDKMAVRLAALQQMRDDLP